MGPKLLVVEDEINVRETLVERLEAEGFDVQAASTATEAYQKMKTYRFEIALLDVGLPDGSGFDIAQRVRANHPLTAILFLTAFGQAEERIRGLELGAEDYIVKPFHIKELILRIRNTLKRASQMTSAGEQDGIQVGRARVYFSRFEAEIDHKIEPLTHKECALLKLLVDRKGQVVSRNEILDEVWSLDECPTLRTVDNFIVRLRKRIEPDPDSPAIIRSVRGVGYQLRTNNRKTL